MSRRPSTHFSYSEFTFSQTAARMGREVVIEPSSLVEIHIKELCLNVLEPLRAHLNRPIRITSGYRPEWLNKAIGGSASSQHMIGQAADIVVDGVPPDLVAKTLIDAGIEFDQLIVEFGRWVHVSFNFGRNRGEALKASKVNGETVYSILTRDDMTEGYF